MADLKGFVFFCEDVRTEAGGKLSYMGVLGPEIRFDPIAEPAPLGATRSLAKLVVVAMIEAPSRANLDLEFLIRFENAPEGVTSEFKNATTVQKSGTAEQWLAQFNINFPNLPVQAGMQVLASFTAEGQTFEGSLSITDNLAVGSD